MMHEVNWEEELAQIMARVDISDIIGFIYPWIMKVTVVSEDGEEALEHIFRDVLKKYGVLKTIWFAFTIGQAFERAVMMEDNPE
jgi:hypothetical protein